MSTKLGPEIADDATADIPGWYVRIHPKRPKTAFGRELTADVTSDAWIQQKKKKTPQLRMRSKSPRPAYIRVAK